MRFSEQNPNSSYPKLLETSSSSCWKNQFYLLNVKTNIDYLRCIELCKFAHEINVKIYTSKNRWHLFTVYILFNKRYVYKNISIQ